MTPLCPRLPRFLATASLLLCTASAQDQFAVATVKLSDGSYPIVAWRNYPGGRVEITNYVLQELIAIAYSVSSYRITGGPSWASGPGYFYNITAKPPAGSPAAAFLPPKPETPPSPEICAMMRTLLADRFALKLHRETRMKNVFALVVAKGGPKFQPATDPSAEPRDLSTRSGELDWHSIELTRLIAWLEADTRETVLDRTGLTGKYDFKLSYSSNKDANAAQPPFVEAVETQLGLKLQAAKEPIEMLIIDEAKHPVDN